MQRLFTTLVVAAGMLFAASAPPVGAGVLTKFSEARIIIEAHPGLRALAMNEENIKTQVRDWLRNHLAGLEVKGPVPPFIKVSVLVQEDGGVVYGYLGIQIVRQVTINDLDLTVMGGVWQTGGIVKSRVSDTKNFVMQSLEQLLGKFAEQWHRDNM